MILRTRHLLAVLALAALFPVAARAQSLEAKYNISLLGLGLGQATISGTFDSDRYRIEARAKLSGLAALVSRSQGGAQSSGLLAGGRTIPAAYATTAANSKMTRTVRMALAGGAVRGIDITPPFTDQPGRVPLRDEHRRGVVDPLSALVMAVPGREPIVGPAACNRTLPIFDGYTRFDVTLSYAGKREVNTPGYKGPVAVCAARYTPIAGHRPLREGTKYMTENRDMEAWLAPVGNSRVVVPYRISVKTQIGTTIIEAREFNVSSARRAAAN